MFSDMGFLWHDFCNYNFKSLKNEAFMSGIDGVVLASGTKRLSSDIELFGAIRITTDKFGTGAKVGNVRLPNFNNSVEMYTKTEPSMSDEELKEAIAKIAREDAAKGQLQNQTKEFLDLKKEYIASVSPDREGIVTNSTKQIFEIAANINSPKSKNKGQALTLLELLMDKEGKKIKAINMSCSAYTASLENDKLTHADFCDSKNGAIATYGSNGWSSILTKEEEARQQEFYSIYNGAWHSAKDEINAKNNISVPKHLEGGTAIDSYA
jgi:hypothetical protein